MGFSAESTSMFRPKRATSRKDGSWAIEPKFDQGFAFSEGLARVRVGTKLAFTAKNGNLVLGPLKDLGSAADFSGGLALVRVKTSWGFMDPSGRLVIPPEYTAAYGFSEVGAGSTNGRMALY